MLSTRIPPKRMKPIFYIMIIVIYAILLFGVVNDKTPPKTQKTGLRGKPLSSSQTTVRHAKIASRNEPEIKLYNIPLDKKTQEFIIKQSELNNVSPELIFAIIKVESNFQKGLISKNSNHSYDKFLPQLNSKVFSPRNEYHAITLAIQHIKQLHDYWMSQGMSEEDAYHATIQAYHSGVYGTKKIFRHYGMKYETKYFKAVDDYKNKLEMEY